MGGLGWAAGEGVLPLPGPIARRLADTGPDGVIPSVPAGREGVSTRYSRARGHAARRNGMPFVLAGATGRPDGWAPPHDGDDPLGMVHDEIPGWCADLGFDTSRLAVWGWSLGGRGSLLLADQRPGFVRAVAAFSPAISVGDAVFDGVAALAGTPIGLWCGKSDGFYDAVRALRDRLPAPAAVAAFDKGAHTRGYWNRITPAAFDYVAGRLVARSA